MGEKKKNIIVLEKDGHTIVINGKRNNIYEIPAHGLAMIIKEVNINLGEYFVKKNQSDYDTKLSGIFGFAGIASTVLSSGLNGEAEALVASGAIVLSTACVIKAAQGLVKCGKAKKEIKRCMAINEKLGREIELRMMFCSRKEDTNLTMKILLEAANVLEEYRLNEII